MNCWYCSAELMWGADHDISEDDSEFCMETNLSCPNPDCNAEVTMYLPKHNDGENYN